MPSRAVITINENQWAVSIASTYAELTTGLSGVASLAAGTGMLFILGVKRQVTVDTSKMLFPLDIIFISENSVIDVASNIQPGYLVTEETPCDMFLEVNAGEATGVEAGDTVSVEQLVTILDNITPVIAFAIPLVALGFVCSLAGGMAGLIGGSSSPPKQLVERRGKGLERFRHSAKYPEHVKMASEITDFIADAAANMFDVEGEVEEAVVDMKPISQRAHRLVDEAKDRAHRQASAVAGLPYSKEIQAEYMPKLESYLEAIAEDVSDVDAAIARKDQDEATEFSHGVGDMARAIGHLHEEALIDAYERLSGEKVRPSGHHSMWLTLEQRKELEKKYGAVAVRWAEEATRPGDIKAAERAAEYYYKKVKEALGLGHLSPELTEEQIMKLREVLGLPVDMAEILRIHRETGYVP